MLHEGDGGCSRGFSLLGMKISLRANRSGLIEDDEYFLGKGGQLHSLLSNFGRLEEIAAAGNADLTLSLIDEPGSPFGFFQTGNGRYSLTGAIIESEIACRDKRSCIFGNMGLFSKILVRELEYRGIYSIHSTSFYDRKGNRLYLAMGGSGSGKSTILLKAISLGGIEVFGTELTHFSFAEGKARMLKGSLWQNCRMGNLVFDFPELLERFGLEVPEGDPWHSYQSVSFSDLQVREDVLDSVSIALVMPRIEGERRHSSIRRTSALSAKSALYQNLSDKVSPPTLLWGSHFVPSIDSPDRQTARMEAAIAFLSRAPIAECWSVLSSPEASLDGIYPIETSDTRMNTQEDHDE